MRRSTHILFVLFTIIRATQVATVAAADPAGFRFTETEQGVLISEGNRKILFYQRRPKSLGGKFERANYVHPLYDLDGNELTEDFPKDHLHHRGIFWAWHQLWVGDRRAGDPWACQDAIWDVTRVNTKLTGDASAELTVDLTWKCPQFRSTVEQEDGDLKPLVREQTTIRVHRASPHARKIDFEIRLTALVPQIRIGGSENDKGYGGFSPRVKLPDDVRFVGETGDLQPQRTSVAGGAWLDITGDFQSSGTISGLAVLGHPTNPGFPQRWILRKRGSMQNAAWPGRNAVPLSLTEPTELRYRLIVHTAKAKTADLQAWHREYVGWTRAAK